MPIALVDAKVLNDGIAILSCEAVDDASDPPHRLICNTPPLWAKELIIGNVTPSCPLTILGFPWLVLGGDEGPAHPGGRGARRGALGGWDVAFRQLRGAPARGNVVVANPRATRVYRAAVKPVAVPPVLVRVADGLGARVLWPPLSVGAGSFLHCLAVLALPSSRALAQAAVVVAVAHRVAIGRAGLAASRSRFPCDWLHDQGSHQLIISADQALTHLLLVIAHAPITLC